MVSNALLKIIFLEGSRLKPFEIKEYFRTVPQEQPSKIKPKIQFNSRFTHLTL